MLGLLLGFTAPRGDKRVPEDRRVAMLLLKRVIWGKQIIPSAKADQNPQWPHKLYFHGWLPVGAPLATPCKQRIN